MGIALNKILPQPRSEQLLQAWVSFLGNRQDLSKEQYTELLVDFMDSQKLSAKQGFCLGAILVGIMADAETMKFMSKLSPSNRVN